MSEKSLEEEIMIKAQENRKLARYMSSTQDLVEEQIRKAREKGAFDNLEGYGKPVNLYENPYEPPEMRMANKILKDNDFAPFWIKLGQEIDSDLEKLKQDVDWFVRYIGVFWAEKRSAAAMQHYEKKQANFLYEKELTLNKINKKILDYNLQCPFFRMSRGSLVIEEEMQKIVAAIEKAKEEALNQ